MYEVCYYDVSALRRVKEISTVQFVTINTAMLVTELLVQNGS